MVEYFVSGHFYLEWTCVCVEATNQLSYICLMAHYLGLIRTQTEKHILEISSTQSPK